MSSGKVQVYTYDDDTSDWIKLGNEIKGMAGDELGTSMSLSADGSTLAIGVPKSDVNGVDSGQVRVYSWDDDASDWSRMGDNINGLVAGERAGRAVALSSDGKILAVGAPFVFGSWGQVNVYTWDESSSTWNQLGQDLSGTAGDQLGTSLALSADGKTVAIGAPASSTGGYVQVYTFDETSSNWIKAGQQIDGDAQPGDNFGSSVSASDDGLTIVIGAPKSDVNGITSGSATVYKWDDVLSNWQREGDVVKGEQGDELGTSVSMSADGITFAAGSPFSDDNGLNSGQANVYEND